MLDARVLSRFVDGGGRITTIPSKHTVRLGLLDWLAQDFDPGARFTEKQVNEILLRRHDDYPALRRYLVEMGFLARENGIYWRTGGTGVATSAE